MWLRFARLGPEMYLHYLATLQWREEHGEDMKKWDGKPTSSLAGRVRKLKRETPTTRIPSRIKVAPVSQNSRRYRNDDMTDPLEGTSETYVQEENNVCHDQE
ncbi:hypothetical protein HGM15179_015035 [Zosterops borbonicus]|uniref:Uncharacterized protein n=1 Tax=Zosterops borbonicus TaxID=364589 RepID=A0A8K1G5V5_9PASS|nr:hypothetical protein HGM15179_015035 [Zosterops borbonicus]